MPSEGALGGVEGFRVPHKSRAGWAHHHQSIRGGRSELYPVCSLGSCTLGIFRILIGTSILSTLQFPGGSRTQKKLPCRVSRRSCPKGEAGRRPTTTHLNPIARFIIKVYPTHQTDLSPDPIPRVELHRPHVIVPITVNSVSAWGALRGTGGFTRAQDHLTLRLSLVTIRIQEYVRM